MKRSNLMTIIFFLMLMPLHAQETIWLDFESDLRNLEARRDTFHMFIDGKKVGSWHWRVEKSDETITFSDISILDGQVREDATLRLNRQSMLEGDIDVEMVSYTQGWRIKNQIQWDDNRIRGTFSRSGGTHDDQSAKVDTAIAGIVPRGILIGLLPTLDLKAPLTRDLKLMGMLGGRIWDVKMEVRAIEKVIVPAGEFEAVPVALLKKGQAGVSNVFYLTQTVPRRVVKVDVLEQEMSIELLEL